MAKNNTPDGNISQHDYIKTHLFALLALALILMGLTLFPFLTSASGLLSTTATLSNPLTFVQKMSDAWLDGVVGITATSNCLYAAIGLHGWANSYGRDAASGVLTPYTNYSGGAYSMRAIVSPNETHVYVAAHDVKKIRAIESSECVFSSQLIGDYTVEPGLDGVQGLALSPDGSRLYAVSETDNALVVFDRDNDTGELIHNQTLFDGSGGVDGLDGAYSAAVSPDGYNVYVTGYVDDAVAIFRWIGGTLNYSSVIKDTDSGVDGLDGANSVAVSPDGNQVYVASRWDNAVAIFERSPTSGLLTYQGMVRDGVNGVDGLYGARALAINPDGSELYVASQYDDALAVFERDAATGALTFIKAYKDGVDGVDGLDTADGIAVSPSGGYVYVSGFGDDAIAVFARHKVYLPAILRD